jgi:hypothetical protein
MRASSQKPCKVSAHGKRLPKPNLEKSSTAELSKDLRGLENM